jgi:hypothetical protein
MSVGLMARPRLGTAPARDEALDEERTGRPAVPRAHLWGLHDLRRLIRMLALSATGIVIAWLVASGTTDLSRQETAVAGGIVATAVAIVGLTGWLLAGMRTVRELREDAVQDMRALIARRSEVTETPALTGDLVTGAGMTHYHLASCLMVRGKATQVVDGTQLSPCPLCLPGEQP